MLSVVGATNERESSNHQRRGCAVFSEVGERTNTSFWKLVGGLAGCRPCSCVARIEASLFWELLYTCNVLYSSHRPRARPPVRLHQPSWRFVLSVLSQKRAACMCLVA